MPPKKRGRKPKKTKVAENAPKKVHKKRGRNPKGGKIIKKPCFPRDYQKN